MVCHKFDEKSLGEKTPHPPERVKPSGHDEAAVLKPKPPHNICKLLIDKKIPPPHRIRAETQELYVLEVLAADNRIQVTLTTVPRHT